MTANLISYSSSSLGLFDAHWSWQTHYIFWAFVVAVSLSEPLVTANTGVPSQAVEIQSHHFYSLSLVNPMTHITRPDNVYFIFLFIWVFSPPLKYKLHKGKAFVLFITLRLAPNWHSVSIWGRNEALASICGTMADTWNALFTSLYKHLKKQLLLFSSF